MGTEIEYGARCKNREKGLESAFLRGSKAKTWLKYKRKVHPSPCKTNNN